MKEQNEEFEQFEQAPEVIEQAPEVTQEAPQVTEEQPSQEPEAPKIERRGRKKGGKNRPRTAAKKTTPPPAQKSEAQEIDDIINQHNEASAPEPIEAPEATPIEEKRRGKISGLILLTVIDAIAPILLIKAASLINSKFKKINPQKIRLTQEEKNDLSEIADEVAATIDANPLLLLSISLGGIYMAKITSEI
jgi:hypothetical protein